METGTSKEVSEIKKTVQRSTFKVRTGETKGARTEERGTRQKGQGDKNSRNFYPAFIKSRGLNILNAKGRSPMSRRSLSPVMRISAFAA